MYKSPTTSLLLSSEDFALLLFLLFASVLLIIQLLQSGSDRGSHNMALNKLQQTGYLLVLGTITQLPSSQQD